MSNLISLGVPQLHPKPVEQQFDDDYASNVGTVQYYNNQEDNGPILPNHLEGNVVSNPKKGKNIPSSSGKKSKQN